MANELKNFTLTSICNIQNAIENNKLIIFVGAGVSRNSGIPTWAELIKELAKDLGIKSKYKDDKGEDLFSYDEYLKIPQYYYNERKIKEYTDKIKSILNIPAIPNKIHELLFDLNPVHLVTTNYDNLLEQQANLICGNKIYGKVANDEELASAKECNFIIKMHGEFDNIVLKESDYDSYSNNFKLLESYVKGLFATHAILFVGFSAEDSNIRKILQWIKDIIGDKHQPAYLIDINDHSALSPEEFRIRFDYYRNQGIFTLYLEQIREEVNALYDKYYKGNDINLKAKGLDLYKFLYFIKNSNNFNINKYYNTLKQLEPLNAIDSDMLGIIFNTQIPERLSLGASSFVFESKQQTYDMDTLRLKKVLLTPEEFEQNIKLLYDNSLLPIEIKNRLDNFKQKVASKKQLKDYNNEEKAQLKQIISNITDIFQITEDEKTKVKYIFEKIKQSIDIEQKLFIEDNILNYNLKKTTCFDDNLTVSVFNNAFYFYKTNNLLEAYYELNKISNSYSNEPVIYYISEFNKKTVAKALKCSQLYGEEENNAEISRIIEEGQKINLEQIINKKMPQSLKEVFSCLTNANVQKKCLEIIEISEKISNYKLLVEGGGTGFNNNIQELYKKARAFFNFVMQNYIFINDYKQTQDLYYYLTKAILTSYSTKEQENCNFFNFGVCKIEAFDRFDFYIIIENLKNKNFIDLLKSLKINKLEISGSEEKTFLLSSFDSFLQSILSNNKQKFYNKLSNYLTLLSHIDLDFEDFKFIIEKYTQFVNLYNPKERTNELYNFKSNFIKMLYSFISNFKFNYKDNNKLYFELYEEIIKKYKGHYNFDTRNYYYLILHCIIRLSSKKNYKLKNKEIIDFYIDNIKNIDDAATILTQLYSVADSSYKLKIKNIFKTEKYSNININNCDPMYYAIVKGIIKFTKSQEIEFINTISSYIQERKDLEQKSESSREPVDVLVANLVDFIIEKKFKHMELVQKIIIELKEVVGCYLSINDRIEDYIRLLSVYYDPINFNYKNIEFDDLAYFNDNILKIIESDKKKVADVINVYINKFDANNESKKTIENIKKKISKVLNQYIESDNN